MMFTLSALTVGLATVSAIHPPFPSLTEPDKCELFFADPEINDFMTIFPNSMGPNFDHDMISLSDGRPGIEISNGDGPVTPILDPKSAHYFVQHIIEGLTYIGWDWNTQQNVERTYGEMIELHNLASFLIWHKGELIYEKYPKEMTKEDRHALQSATKSFLGLVAASLVAEGVIDETKLVSEYVPELGVDVSSGGFGSATVRQVMDMSTSLQSKEHSMDDCDLGAALVNAIFLVEEGKEMTSLSPGCEFWLDYSIVAGNVKLTPEFNDICFESKGWPGPHDYHSFLEMVKPGDGEHGDHWDYNSPNTDTLAWIVNNALQMYLEGNDTSDLPSTAQDYLEQLIWSKIGTEQDFFITTDSVGEPGWGNGGQASPRDMLRLGQVLLNGGKASDGSQIIPAAAIDDIFESTDTAREQFPDGLDDAMPAELKELFGEWSYRSQFRSNNGRAAYMEGFWGQFLYVDREEDLIVVKNGQSMVYPVDSPDHVNALTYLSKHFSDGSIPTLEPKNARNGNAGGESSYTSME